MKTRRLVSTIFLGLAAGCATPGQVRQVEARIAAMEKTNAKADSARAAEQVRLRVNVEHLTDLFTVFVATSTRAFDSLKLDHRAFASDVLGIQRELLSLEKATGANASDIARLNNTIQQSTNAMPQQAGGVSALPPDESLLQQADRNTQGMAYSEARTNLWDLLKNRPAPPIAASAYLKLGQTFCCPQQPDSQRFYFKIVYDSFPSSEDAPRAIYKLAQLAEAGTTPDVVQARMWYKLIFDKYKNAPEWIKADAWLKQNP